MEANVDNILYESFTKLPPVVQEAIAGSRFENALHTLAKKYKLHLDQWTVLENEVLFVLLGIEEPRNLIANIQRELKIDKSTASTIVADLNELIFKPIRELVQASTQQEHQTLAGTMAQKTTPADAPTYKAGESSATRKDVLGDPYREPIE